MDGTVTTLTNSYNPETTSATVKKVWDDANNQDGKQPESLTVTLSNGTEVTLDETNGWTATVTDLPHGTYTVTELTGWSWNYACAVPSQEVTLTVEETGVKPVTFTNTYQQPDWLTDEARAENQFS